jgi:hypothetical protein
LPSVRDDGGSASFGDVGAVGARNVVRTFAGIRLAIGIAFAVAPGRLNRGSRSNSPDILMTRSFAAREIALGVGGLLATTGPDATPSPLRMWAGLGVLTDAGDFAAACAQMRRGEPAAVPAIFAASGLLIEGWALRASGRP